MDRSKLLFWIDGAVEEVDMVVLPRPHLGRYVKHYCVDLFYSSDSTSRYGKYGSFDGLQLVGWKNIKLKDFPAEFRAQLLLLGVS